MQGMPELTFVAVAPVGSIPLGTGRAFPVGGKMVAVFCVGEDQYQSIDDFCPHMGASLAEGQLEEGVVSCPWHAWRFRVSDGTWCDNPKIKIDAYPVRVRDGQIEVGVATDS